MTRHFAWHFYRQLAREGYRYSYTEHGVELVKGTTIYAVPRGQGQLALRAVLSVAFDQVRRVHHAGGTHYVTA